MNRGEVLDLAKVHVNNRGKEHGDAADGNFALVAAYWSAHLGVTVTTTDVALMMNLYKTARLKFNSGHVDSWVDACGYMALGCELECEVKEVKE